MNLPDPFEERLGRVPLRQAPSSLRAHVLHAARPTPSLSAQRGSMRPGGWMGQWFWPNPIAWGALGLAWLAIALLNLIALESPDHASGQRAQSRVSPAWTAALREQRKMLHSLLEDPPLAGQLVEPGPGAQLWPSRQNSGARTLA
jgi:hypothetical protein